MDATKPARRRVNLTELSAETERLKFEATAFNLAKRFLDLQSEIESIGREYIEAQKLGDQSVAMSAMAKAMSTISLHLGTINDPENVRIFDQAFQIFTHAAAGRVHPDISGGYDMPLWLDAPERINVEIIAVAIVSYFYSQNHRTKCELQDLVIAALERAKFYNFRGKADGKYAQANKRTYLRRRETALFNCSPTTRTNLSSVRNRQIFDGMLKLFRGATVDLETDLNVRLEALEVLARTCPNGQNPT